MTCAICGAPTKKRFEYCPVCLHFIQHRKDRWARIAALKQARRLDGFHCEYSGELLNVTDPSDPFHLEFDHKIPGEDELATSAAIVTDSKVEMIYLELPVVVHETVSHWDTGVPFKKDIVLFSAWRGKAGLKSHERPIGRDGPRTEEARCGIAVAGRERKRVLDMRKVCRVRLYEILPEVRAVAYPRS